MELSESGPDDNASRGWLVSFSDLLFILLTFMVMVFSLSVEERRASPHQAPSHSTLAPNIVDLPAAPLPVPAQKRVQPAEELDYVSSALKMSLQGDPVLAQVHVSHEADRVVLTFPRSALSASLSPVPSGDEQTLLRALSRPLSNLRQRVAVRVDLSAGSEAKLKDWTDALKRARRMARVLETNSGRPVDALVGDDQAAAQSGESHNSNGVTVVISTHGEAVW